MFYVNQVEFDKTFHSYYNKAIFKGGFLYGKLLLGKNLARHSG